MNEKIMPGEDPECLAHFGTCYQEPNTCEFAIRAIANLFAERAQDHICQNCNCYRCHVDLPSDGSEPLVCEICRNKANPACMKLQCDIHFAHCGRIGEGKEGRLQMHTVHCYRCGEHCSWIGKEEKTYPQILDGPAHPACPADATHMPKEFRDDGP